MIEREEGLETRIRRYGDVTVDASHGMPPSQLSTVKSGTSICGQVFESNQMWSYRTGRPNCRKRVLTILVDTATPCTCLEFFVGFSFAVCNRFRREIDWAVCMASYWVCVNCLHVFWKQPESSPG